MLARHLIYWLTRVYPVEESVDEIDKPKEIIPYLRHLIKEIDKDEGKILKEFDEYLKTDNGKGEYWDIIRDFGLA